MSEPDDNAAGDTRDETDDELLKALAWTPRLAPFSGTARYRVLSCLGEGGFGVVYEVEDVELGRRLALKTLKPHRIGFAANVQRLKREFRSVADLVHPNLVGLHELSTDGARWFFTMDLVQGSHLLDHVGAGAAREQRLRASLAQLVVGVSALHEAGIVHRDLKPSNVLVEPGGRVVILDFGLAGGEQPGDRDLLVAGTPVYMAPEAADGVVGAAGDWYAVGVMLYEALAGRRPFAGEDRASEPEPPSAYAPAPSDLERLCLALLRPDPRSRPTADAILALLGGDAGAPRMPRASGRGLFIGRAAELSALRSAYAAVERGEPRLVRMHGQPGVGKSTLLARFRDILAADGRAAILSGRCHERESVPFKAFDGVIDALQGYLAELPRNQASALMPRDIHLVAQLFPVLEGLPAVRDVPRRQASAVDPRELRARAFVAVKELLARVADRQPLVMAIDDLQWGDIDSARLLAQLVTPPDRPAMLVLLSYRSDDAVDNPTLRETLATIAGAGAGGSEVALAPLAPSDAEELAASLLRELEPGRPAGVARAIADRGEGHPLFIAELVRAQLSAGTAGGPPPTLLDIIWQRVAKLSAAARALLETVAVAGRPLATAVCFDAAGIGGGGVDAVRLLRAEQMLRVGDRGDINVFHDRVRDAVLMRADQGTRQSRHLALARALERAPVLDLEALARHFDAADARDQAASYALRAADAAMTGLAFERAAALYQMAIDRSDQGSAELYQKLGFALRDAGRVTAAGEAFLAAAHRVTGADRRRTELMGMAAEHMLVVGNQKAGREVLREALADVGEEIPRSHGQAMRMAIRLNVLLRFRRARFRRRSDEGISPDELLRMDVIEAACRGLEPTDSLLAMGLRARHYRRAMKAGEPRRAARAMIGCIGCLMGMVNALPPVADELLDAADAIGAELADPEIVARSLFGRGLSRFFFTEWAAAADFSERAAAFIAERCRGMASEQHDALLIAAMCHLRGGRFETAQRIGESLLLWAVERGDAVYRKQVCAGVLAPLRLAADDPADAERLLQEIGGEQRCPSVMLRTETLAAVSMYNGDPGGAVDAWRSHWERLEEFGINALAGLRVIAARSLGGALLACGEGRRDRREESRLLRGIRRLRFPTATATAAFLRALRAGRDGDDERAGAGLAAAAHGFDQAGQPHDAAACRYRLGELTGGAVGARAMAAAEDALRAMGVVNPARWCAMAVPPVSPAGRLLVE